MRAHKTPSRSLRQSAFGLCVALAMILPHAARSVDASSHAGSAPAESLPAAVTLASLDIPGEPEFAAVAREILGIRFAIQPSIASGAGLFDDAAHLPSFHPDTVSARMARLDACLAALRAMEWRSWEIDRQIDWRWMYTVADEARIELAGEKLYLRRPASWLEPFAGNYIALLTYVPHRIDIRERLTRGIPGMVDEMRRVVVSPTSRDVTTAVGVADGVIAILRADGMGPDTDAAVAALSAYVDELEAMDGLREFEVIGAERYEDRLRRVLLLPWSPRQLVALALGELADVDAALNELRPRLSPDPEPTPAQLELAESLDQDKVLALYDEITDAYREFMDASNLITIPSEVGPIRARPTPQAMIPLTGDGGSMNPPPPFGDTNVSWWNVENYHEDWTPERRIRRVMSAHGHRRTGMGPYAAHEGVPGHHLQLAIARLHPNPLRSIMYDNGMVEGWAMYAEEMFWAAGGFDDSPDAEFRMLSSWRARVRRVFYDVHVECGDWTLQEAADFRHQTRRGQAPIDPDVLRAINWPTQLICYFCGKMQILELKEAYRAKLGDAFTERGFHDALLAEGSIPVALIRAKLLGEEVPGL